jgi:hypothetical protein
MVKEYLYWLIPIHYIAATLPNIVDLPLVVTAKEGGEEMKTEQEIEG